MSIRHRLQVALPLRRPGPLASACAAAAAIVVVLALAVVPVRGGQTETPPTPTGIVAAAYSAPIAAAPVRPTTAAALADRHQLQPPSVPSPTPRVIQRPHPSPAATPTTPAKPTPPLLSETQLVENRGFESLDAWYLEEGARIARGDAHRGDGCLLIDSTGGYAGQRFAVEAGVTYRVALWARVSGPGASGASIGIRYEDGAFHTVAPIEPVAVGVSDPDWKKVVFTFAPPAGATRALITFWNPSGGTSLLIDDISIRAMIVE